MADLVIVGAGGFAREVASLVEQINATTRAWNLLGFYDAYAHDPGSLRGVPVLRREEVQLLSRSTAYVVGIGAPEAKLRAATEMAQFGFTRTATLIHPSIHLDSSTAVAGGAIVFGSSTISVDIVLGCHVVVYYGCTIGHDTQIGSYTQLSPSSAVSGRVTLAEGVFLGANATIIEEISVGAWAKIGAGAVVIRNVPPYTTVVGVPARPLHT